MDRLSNDEVLKSARESGVEFVRLQFTDIFGIMKNVAITIEELERVLREGIIFDGSSVNGPVRDEETDMYLKPDPSTFVVYPWRTSSGLDGRLICDVYTLNGEPFYGDPRWILRREISDIEAMGYTVKLSPECEFFLFHTDEKGRPTTETHDNAGYYDLAPVDLGEAARRDMAVALKQMGFLIEASHHEIAPGQHEIDLQPEDVLYAADGIETVKTVVRVIAQRHGLHATFMPKPVYDIAGSGLHMNVSLFKDGRNALYDRDDKNGLSDDAYCFIGGLLRHSHALTAIVNPTVNSYKRLISGYDSPLYITWSVKNAESFVKVPPKRGMSTSIEMRSPDPSCNPYLAAAAILQAGADGIRNSMVPPPSIDENSAEDAVERLEDNTGSLPVSLSGALDALRGDEVIKSVLGDYVYAKFSEAKMVEWEEYSKRITPWEIEQYLTKF